MLYKNCYALLRCTDTTSNTELNKFKLQYTGKIKNYLYVLLIYYLETYHIGICVPT